VVTTPAVLDAMSCVCRVGVENVSDFRTVLKAVFTTRVEEYGPFDRLFQEFWLNPALRIQNSVDISSPEDSESGQPQQKDEVFPAEASVSDSQEMEAWNARPLVMYSPREVLRETDFKDVPEFQDYRMARLIRELLRPFLRSTRIRKRPIVSGPAPNFRKLLRKNIQYGGEIYELPALKPRRRIRRLVFLCDVSGSMNPYLAFMLRFIRELQAVPAKVETFVFATRLHRVTQVLTRDPFAVALEKIGRTVKDWAGGTRIGSCLEEFTSYNGGALLGPSTIVLIFSDGWDRGDRVLLEREMIKIHRRAYRVLWINPLLGGSLYEPTCRGMKTALAHVDWFLPGHNVVSLERLAWTLRGLM